MTEERDKLTTADIAAPEPVPDAEASAGEPQHVDEAELEPLLSPDETSGFRDRWLEVQTGFVDDPRRVVEQADGLVAELMQRLAQTFADERKLLEEQWAAGDEADTETLRVALKRYRSFFERLLTT